MPMADGWGVDPSPASRLAWISAGIRVCELASIGANNGARDESGNECGPPPAFPGTPPGCCTEPSSVGSARHPPAPGLVSAEFDGLLATGPAPPCRPVSPDARPAPELDPLEPDCVLLVVVCCPLADVDWCATGGELCDSVFGPLVAVAAGAFEADCCGPPAGPLPPDPVAWVGPCGGAAGAECEPPAAFPSAPELLVV